MYRQPCLSDSICLSPSPLSRFQSTDAIARGLSTKATARGFLLIALFTLIVTVSVQTII